MKPMETLQDLIEEAKVRILWWAICVLGFSYLMSLTSKSAWTNIPVSILVLSAFRFLLCEVEIRRRVRPVRKQSYLSHLEKQQLSVDDPRLLPPLPVTASWSRKIGSPLIEAAINDFISKLLQDFVIDLWYSSITPDKEAPELIHALINDVLGEISERLKEINLVDLLTRDIVDLIGNHLDLYRRNQVLIGVDVMGTLSFEQRDEKLKNHLIVFKELHPALISSECEYKVLKQLMGGVLAIVLRHREAQSPLVHCFARELLTCLVMQPVMNLASPGYINELIEYLVLNINEDSRDARTDKPTDQSGHRYDISVAQGLPSKGEPDSRKNATSANQKSATTTILSKSSDRGEETLNISKHYNLPPSQAESAQSIQPSSADWARVLDAARQRRTQVLAPENLENLWTKGRNYQSKGGTRDKTGNSLGFIEAGSRRKLPGTINSGEHPGKSEKETTHGSLARTEYKYVTQIMQGSSSDAHVRGREQIVIESRLSQDPSGGRLFGGQENTTQETRSKNIHIKRSSSTPALEDKWDIGKTLIGEGGKALAYKEFHNQNLGMHKEMIDARNTPGLLLQTEGTLHVPKIRCRVVGAYFEKVGSKSFAVYSIAVTAAENKTWFVKRRYRNFERLHRHLKDIPNYTLHLPPKRFLSSSIDDYFVHKRCILLDKYLQDLLSIANVAEQHEVWDFLSMSSKNYSFGKSTSVMKTLAVNVDDAVDDIVRQFKGVSDGLLRKVSGSSPSSFAVSSGLAERDAGLPWNEEEICKHTSSSTHMESSRSLSDDEGGKDGAQDEVGSPAQINGWHSDNELQSKSLPPRIIKRSEQSRSFGFDRGQQSVRRLERRLSLDGYTATSYLEASDLVEDPVGVPPEWTPPKVSVPLLNLVDKIFQLNRRGWLRRQVFWISKQILQLVMEDAIDDWLLRQIHWLRRDDIIAQGIRWVQDVLWPNGTFFIKLENNQGETGGDQYSQVPRSAASYTAGDKNSAPASFELQLEAARRASEVKKMILGGAPATLVSLIGHKQYQRCAKDIYFFLQSTVCVKQLAYGMLELLLVSVFPELRDVILDVHDKMHA